MAHTTEKKSKKQRNAERTAGKKLCVASKIAHKKDLAEKKAVAKARALLPIGGKCPECKLRVRTNSMEKHRAGISHTRRIATLEKTRRAAEKQEQSIYAF